MMHSGYPQIRERVSALAATLFMAMSAEVAAGHDEGRIVLEQQGLNHVQILPAGEDNRIAVYQLANQHPNGATLSVGGNDNRVVVDQQGDFLSARVVMGPGAENRLSLGQAGASSQQSLEVEGDSNRVDLLQSQARDGFADAVIKGQRNNIALSQYGVRQRQVVGITGSGNGVYARQR